ncbi:hypothetical protein BKP45_19150 [Anaerobacillus alkalidiazotrophicus]|uniref:JAB domain-containing protein n=1 Tax=Anaerobacillus alkalidiazotrophicus TaxID=472963 RepID=A0A1S2M1G8_9BACI|nr:M67 family metallopeptidase [Anaerobacillus alkalidiazotrophicus]OIJ18558.1 hypothetical protein BKP45_19150 [Anaerobacillus alkalidiazotrophicus]
MQRADTFIMKKEVYLEMINCCRQKLPLEGCGLISGREGFGETLWCLPDSSISQSMFYISQDTLFSVVKQIEKRNEKLTGVFHSHPTTPAYPSSYDIRNNPYSHLAYLIVSFKKSEPDVGIFKIINQKHVSPLKIKVV